MMRNYKQFLEKWKVKVVEFYVNKKREKKKVNCVFASWFSRTRDKKEGLMIEI